MLLSYELANFIFNYFLLKRDAVKFMYKNNIVYDTGCLEHGQINKYQILILIMQIHVMETLLVKMLPEWKKKQV